MSRQELADEANKYLHDNKQRTAMLSANYVGKLERGQFRWPDRDYREAFREVLGASADRDLGFYIRRRGDDDPTAPANHVAWAGLHPTNFARVAWIVAGQATLPEAETQTADAATSAALAPPSTQSLAGVDLSLSDSGDLLLVAPAGKFFSGTAIQLQVCPTKIRGQVFAELGQGRAGDSFLAHPRRSLISGLVVDDAGPQLYAMDNRHARHRMASADPHAKLGIPQAYALDEITLGLLWAVTNLDEALLNDDRVLASSQEQLVTYEQLPRSAVSRDLANELTPASTMWLGSHFCASHILRNLAATDDVPMFWTREQHGEEASTWLLFTHKYEYLSRLSEQFPTGMARTFCVPPSIVAASAQTERVLLILAAALMESFRIRVQVVQEPEYESVDGFVLDGQGRAIIANWVRADGLWHVDVTSNRPAVRQYADAAGHASTHSVLTAGTPGDRLHDLADYLGVDWSWLIGRCAELADYGVSGIAEPRSRLLSVAGVDRACGLLGQLSGVRH
ncbi:MAG: XRE family transcriptional regulator [Micromonosporaceae bacterium]